MQLHFYYQADNIAGQEKLDIKLIDALNKLLQLNQSSTCESEQTQWIVEKLWSQKLISR